ncbi:hypothetical protein CSAL01_06230 [Colletotrichum salicis]|uniref:Uncharacterized protein n=1 Tax=Colletotrichum salicis TaxID=1209931 RepID=A0A135V399_9PEZI|nr:hypothetical protein CSAL01_06230 [Colletotrichum salicis]
MKARKGGHGSDTLDVLRRLVCEAEDARGILSSLRGEITGHAYDAIHHMLENQILLIKTQIHEVAPEAGKSILQTPMSNPPPQQSKKQQQQQQQEGDTLQKPPSPLPRPSRPQKIKLSLPRPLSLPGRLSDATPTNDATDQSNPCEKQKSSAREIKGFPPRATRRRRQTTKSSTSRLPAPAEGEIKDHDSTGPTGENQAGRRRHQASVSSPPQRRFNLWPTASNKYSRPAFESLFLREKRQPLRTQKPEDVSVAIHLRKQLDEQEERIEAANVEKRSDDVNGETESEYEGEAKAEVDDESQSGGEGEEGERRGRKRSANHDLSPPTPKKSRSELRSGQNDGRPGRIKRFINSLNPFRSRQTKTQKSRDAEPTTVPSKPYSPEPAVEYYIFEDALNPRDSFDNGEEDQMALRYRDTIAELIQLVDDAPHAITSKDPLVRDFQRKKLEEVQAVLRKIPNIAIARRRIDKELVEIRDEKQAIRTGRTNLDRASRTAYMKKLRRDEGVLLNLRQRRHRLYEMTFVFGAEGAAIITDWILETKKRVDFELEFGARAQMVPHFLRVQKDGKEIFSV